MSSLSDVQHDASLNSDKANKLVESWISTATAPSSSSTVPRYPSQSARDEIHHLLSPIVDFSDIENNKIIFEKIVNIISEKMAYLSQLRLKIKEAHRQKKDFYHDPISGGFYPSFGLSYNDILQQIDYMIDDNLNLRKEITSYLILHQPLES